MPLSSLFSPIANLCHSYVDRTIFIAFTTKKTKSRTAEQSYFRLYVWLCLKHNIHHCIYLFIIHYINTLFLLGFQRTWRKYYFLNQCQPQILYSANEFHCIHHTFFIWCSIRFFIPFYSPVTTVWFRNTQCVWLNRNTLGQWLRHSILKHSLSYSRESFFIPNLNRSALYVWSVSLFIA